MDDHELLIRIDERIESIEKILDSGQKTFRSHDERLRTLEQSQSKAMTYIIAIGSAITIAINGAVQVFAKFWR